MMDSKIVKKATNLASFLSFILWHILYSWIMALQDFYSCFRRLFQALSYLLFASRSNNDNVLASKLSKCRGENANVVSIEEAEIVMEKLGLSWNINEPRPQEQYVVLDMFDEREASLEELREAFDVFDENKDGFIDVEELKKIMDSIGLIGFCEQECQRMIMAFDDNGDGRIDFGEFVKLMEDCCF